MTELALLIPNLQCVGIDAELRSWIAKNGWKEEPNGMVFIQNQEDLIKTKNITEKITFDTVSVVM